MGGLAEISACCGTCGRPHVRTGKVPVRPPTRCPFCGATEFSSIAITYPTGAKSLIATNAYDPDPEGLHA